MKAFTVALGLLLLSTPAFAMGSRPPQKAPSEVAIEVIKPEGNPVEVHSSETTLTVTKCDNCTVAQFDRIKAGAAKVNEVISSQCFMDSLSGMDLIQTNGRTPAEVVNHLRHAGVKVSTKTYYTAKRVLGYTLDSVDNIWINRRYMLEWNVCDMASLLAHEGSHKAGYNHDYKRTARRPKSVPYSINRAMKACCIK